MIDQTKHQAADGGADGEGASNAAGADTAGKSAEGGDQKGE